MNLVYKYGALSTSLGSDLRKQMSLGHEYYNKLVEAENERRKAAWEGDKPPAPPHDDCSCDSCKDHWTALRKKLRDIPPLDIKIFRVQFVLKGLFWGTYLKIEQAFDAAWKKTDMCNTVRFKSWRKGQLAAVQIQKGHRADLQFRLEKAPDSRKGRRARDGRGRYLLQLRIGTSGSTPIFCDPIKLELHRIPKGLPTWVIVTLKWIADRER
jgi:hypothetical protein